MSASADRAGARSLETRFGRDPITTPDPRLEEAIAAVSTQATNSQENPLAGFGPNEWIVEDMYQRYLADPTSVDPAWHDFFADYKPVPDGIEQQATTKPAAGNSAPAATTKPPAPAPATKPAP